MSSSIEPPGIVNKVSPRTVGDTVSRLTEILADKGVKLFAVIDQAAEARAVGLNLRETIMVIFGSPLQGTPVMDASPLAALDLPLKVLVWADGQQTIISYESPSALVSRYGLTPELASNLAGIGPVTDRLIIPDDPDALSCPVTGGSKCGDACLQKRRAAQGPQQPS